MLFYFIEMEIKNGLCSSSDRLCARMHATDSDRLQWNISKISMSLAKVFNAVCGNRIIYIN